MNKKILVVEDDHALSDAFSIVLKKEGYDVDTVFDGKDALERVRTDEYDLILLDLLMPVLDGKGFLKKFDNTSKTPVIVFSNLDAKDDIDEALKLGATRYMLKAWASPSKLADLVKETLD
ncbi:MAG: response regulator [Candidatus Saccharimonadales bacterium]